MLRSFDQAAWASLYRFAETDPLAFEQLLTPALAWRDLARAAFLEEYRAAIAGCPSWPGDAAADALLRILLLGRKFREATRELAEHPNRARAPIRGLVDLMRPEKPVGALADLQA
jgi:maltose alpha-D-glucosyltransferase/alpha-amylase